MRPLDSPALAAGAAPGVANPVQPVAAQLLGALAQPNRTDGDMVRQVSNDALRLVTAQDIARSRLAPRTDTTLGGGMGRMLDWYTEVHRAQDELNRGEWRLT